MSERELVSTVLRSLNEKGYPSESILVETQAPSIDEQPPWLVPDILVVDPKTNERLAVFEIKASASSLDSAILQAFLDAHLEVDSDPLVQLYLVTTSPSEPAKVQWHRLVNGEHLVKMESEDLPVFEALRADRIAARKDKVRQHQERTVDSFKQLAQRLAIGALVILVIDIWMEFSCGLKLLTVNRLILIGVVSALFLVPYAARFKGLGIEWERLVEDGD